jgi:hypothetical protein
MSRTNSVQGTACGILVAALIFGGGTLAHAIPPTSCYQQPGEQFNVEGTNNIGPAQHEYKGMKSLTWIASPAGDG